MSTVDESEALLSDFLQEYAGRAGSGPGYVLRHPRPSLKALVALYRLPRVGAALTDNVEGAAIRSGLARGPAFARTAIQSATAVLPLPQDPAEYVLGHSKQTLRRKVRAAEKLGVRWEKVDDPQERRNLIKLADENERNNARAEYRHAEPDNDDLLGYRLWLVAYSRDGIPLLLSVTPVEGEWALLRYFITLGAGDEHSNARYLMTKVLVEHLARDGVRYLADASSPVNVPNGLRHFQRMLGFRIVRVQLASRRRRRAAA